MSFVFEDLDTVLPDSSIFSNDANNFYVETNLRTKVKIYNLKVVGSSIHYNIIYTSASELLTLDVWDSCANATLTATSYSDLTYDIW